MHGMHVRSKNLKFVLSPCVFAVEINSACNFGVHEYAWKPKEVHARVQYVLNVLRGDDGLGSTGDVQHGDLAVQHVLQDNFTGEVARHRCVGAAAVV